MNKSIVKFQDVHDMLVFTLNNALFGKKLVDEHGYVLRTNGERFQVDNLDVIVISENIEDIEANVLNPFVNERKISTQLNYYYRTLSSSILVKLVVLMNEILQKAYHVKKHSELSNKKERDKYIKEHECNLDISPKYNDLISIVGNSIDENTLKQFKIFQTNVMSKRIESICYYGYNIKEEQANFYITYMDEKDVFSGGVNNNNMRIIRELTSKILFEDDPSFLIESASKETNSKRYDSIIKLYFKMTKRLNAIVRCLDDKEYENIIIDEDKMNKHIKNLNEYSKLAHSRIFVSHKNTSVSTPGPSFSDSVLPSEEKNIIYGATGQPIHLKKDRVFTQVGPDRTYNGPEFPNVVSASSVGGAMNRFTPTMNNVFGNNFSPNQRPSIFGNRSMPMRGGVDLNQALMR